MAKALTWWSAPDHRLERDVVGAMGVATMGARALEAEVARVAGTVDATHAGCATTANASSRLEDGLDPGSGRPGSNASAGSRTARLPVDAGLDVAACLQCALPGRHRECGRHPGADGGYHVLPALMAAIVVRRHGSRSSSCWVLRCSWSRTRFVALAADFASAGSVFAFNGRALGYRYGFISAWMLLGVYIAYSSSIYASNANFLESLAASAHVAIAWPGYAFLFWALALALAYRRISVSTMLIFALRALRSCWW